MSVMYNAGDGCTPPYRVKEVDPSSGEVEEEGYEDEYQLEDAEVTPADYVKPVLVPNFRNNW